MPETVIAEGYQFRALTRPDAGVASALLSRGFPTSGSRETLLKASSAIRQQVPEHLLHVGAGDLQHAILYLPLQSSQ
jgi:hypothetical protein